jgi:hypothetical protein
MPLGWSLDGLESGKVLWIFHIDSQIRGFLGEYSLGNGLSGKVE